MNLFENVKIAIRALTANKLRSILTMLGIIIGVGAVVALLSIGQGATASITSSVEGLGSNLVSITPGRLFQNEGGSQNAQLYFSDYEAIAANGTNMTQVAPGYQTLGTVKFNDKDNKTALLLNGLFTFDVTVPELKDRLDKVALEFSDLGIDPDGNFILPNGNSLGLTHPTQVDLDVCSLNITQLLLGQNNDDGFWLQFVGGIMLSDDLPITGEVDFDGLKISKKGVDWGGIGFTADVAEIGRITAHVKHSPGMLEGNAALALKLGESVQALPGTGGEFRFKKSNGGWYVYGKLDIPPPGVLIADTGLSISGLY